MHVATGTLNSGSTHKVVTVKKINQLAFGCAGLLSLCCIAGVMAVPC